MSVDGVVAVVLLTLAVFSLGVIFGRFLHYLDGGQ